MNQEYGFVWPPGREPFMINPEGKKIALFVNGDIPYVRAGSNKSLAHDDAEATTIFQIFKDAKEGSLVDTEPEIAAKAVPGEVDADDAEDMEHERPAEPDPNEVPAEEVPEAEAGRPPDPSGEGGVGDIPVDDDEKEIEIEGERRACPQSQSGNLEGRGEHVGSSLYSSLSQSVLRIVHSCQDETFSAPSEALFREN